MTKNKLADLTNHLFLQLERLADDDMSTDQLEMEAKRAEAIVKLSDQIIGTADLQLRAAKLYADNGDSILPMLPQIGQAKTAGSDPK